MVEGIFNTVELLNTQLPHKIDGQGLCILHCAKATINIETLKVGNDSS